MFVTKEIKELNITDGAMLEFLKLQEDYTLCNNGYVLISSLDFSYSYVDCEYVDMATITCFDKSVIPTIPYKWDNRKAKYINACLELEQVEEHFEFAAWKLYCVLNGINKNNYDKYKWVLERIKKTPDDMPNVDMPISRAYEIAQLPKNLIDRTYNVNGKSKPIYKMNIKKIRNLKEYV